MCGLFDALESKIEADLHLASQMHDRCVHSGGLENPSVLKWSSPTHSHFNSENTPHKIQIFLLNYGPECSSPEPIPCRIFRGETRVSMKPHLMHPMSTLLFYLIQVHKAIINLRLAMHETNFAIILSCPKHGSCSRVPSQWFSPICSKWASKQPQLSSQGVNPRWTWLPAHFLSCSPW